MSNENMIFNYEKRITILVNSCDSYQDLWHPFFTLLKRYWNPQKINILLNTESVDYSFDGLDIQSVHPREKNVPYGERMLNALSYVKTDYVVMLLDDFFLREQVKEEQIQNIIQWMDNDSDIVYFNCDCTPVYESWEENKYPGYQRIPWGNEYTLNMQAAIWRTKKIKKYWLPNVSPWDWELYTNLRGAVNTRDKFYCATSYTSGFCNYGLKPGGGWAVVGGKWAQDDVKALFEKENIQVDFSKRGKYETNSTIYDNTGFSYRQSLRKRSMKSDIIARCLPSFTIRYGIFVRRNHMLESISCYIEEVFIKYMLLKQRKKWYKKKRNKQIWQKLKWKIYENGKNRDIG